MATHTFDLARYRAGTEYILAIEKLGLRPSAIFWAFDNSLEKFVLVLVTEAFDYAGPLEMSKMLFKAYMKAATPAEIDPFIIRVHSPHQAIIKALESYQAFRALANNQRSKPLIATIRSPSGQIRAEGIEVNEMTATAADLEVSSDWVYRFEEGTKSSTVELARRWKRFSRNVSIAA